MVWSLTPDLICLADGLDVAAETSNKVPYLLNL